MKPYLLIVWHLYYPKGGTDDWVATFATHAEAKAEGEKLTSQQPDPLRVTSGEDYQVVDLRDWTGGE